MGETKNLPFLLRPTAFGREASLSRATVYRMIKDGTLPFTRLGKSIRIPSEALRLLAEKALASSDEQAE